MSDNKVDGADLGHCSIFLKYGSLDACAPHTFISTSAFQDDPSRKTMSIFLTFRARVWKSAMYPKQLYKSLKDSKL